MKNIDRRMLPLYTIRESARYLHIPNSTARYWSVGRGHCPPLFRSFAGHRFRLSFLNLVEMHVLNSMRVEHRIPMPKIRSAIEYLLETFPAQTSKHYPLSSHEFETDGYSLFVERFGKLINASRMGQLAMHKRLGLALNRIRRDDEGVPYKLYPIYNHGAEDLQKLIVMNPRIYCGRPIIERSGVPTWAIHERYAAGESLDSLASDFSHSPLEEVQEAIRYEESLAA